MVARLIDVFFIGLVFGLLIFFNLLLGLEKAHSVELRPHRVLYTMSLERATMRSGVTGASGAMVYKILENCDSWSTETNVRLKIVYVEKGEVKSDWSFVSWESKDGMDYRFRVLHSIDGSLIENYKGIVTRTTPSGVAKAQYFAPKGMVLLLPTATVFPIRHLIELISAADSGKKIFSRTVFDGANANNPYEVNAIIGRGNTERTASSRASLELFERAGLGPVPARNVRMAFFPSTSMKAEPEFELSVNYRSDGIARAIKQDFGHFVMALSPASIELLNRPKCE